MLDRTLFFNKYKVEAEFLDSGLTWDNLEAIYDDYMGRCEETELVCQRFVEYFQNGIPVAIHSIRSRAKNAEHLIEKIIRKRGKYQNKKYNNITVENYRDIVQDLIGARILILAKEEWEGIFDWVMERFKNQATEQAYLAEVPVAYIRYGDRDIFGDKIYREHTNRGYRSQHYVIRFEGYYCELQVRTLAEEVYGEFDHRVKYPYRNDNHFLMRYTNTVAQLTDSIDEIISTCFAMGEKGWELCDQYYANDEYADWRNISQKSTIIEDGRKAMVTEDGRIDVAEYGSALLLRRNR